MTLRSIATGQQSIAFAFRVGVTTVAVIIGETCLAINEDLKEELPEPIELG